MQLSLIKPRANRNHQRGCLRRCKCTCAIFVVHIRRFCSSAGRALEIPEQVLLEMITLIKPLLSKLSPTSIPPPSICSLSSLNEAQVCPGTFADASLTVFLREARRGPERDEGPGFHRRLRMTVINEGGNGDECAPDWFLLRFAELLHPADPLHLESSSSPSLLIQPVLGMYGLIQLPG